MLDSQVVLVVVSVVVMSLVVTMVVAAMVVVAVWGHLDRRLDSPWTVRETIAWFSSALQTSTVKSPRFDNGVPSFVKV